MRNGEKILGGGGEMDNNVTLTLNVDGMSQALEKAEELNIELEKAKSLANDLASMLQSLSFEIDVKS
jgi:hypothetical protein